jgi:hypothetical protein
VEAAGEHNDEPRLRQDDVQVFLCAWRALAIRKVRTSIPCARRANGESAGQVWSAAKRRVAGAATQQFFSPFSSFFFMYIVSSSS